MSIASPFCAFHGQRMVTPSIITSWQSVGVRWNFGEFCSVTPCTITLWQSVKRIMLERIFSCCSIVGAMLPWCLRLNGYQRSPFSVTLPPSARYSRRSTSLCLPFFTARQNSPLPSIIPCPVMDMSCALDAVMALMAFFCPGFRCILRSSVSCMMAFCARCRSIPDFSLNGAVSQMPAGTSTCPPPWAERLSMACCMAVVHSVCPSPTAP